jgi:DNA-binding NarL/FixJ family response regulator
MINVFIIDDHPILIDGIKTIFANKKDNIKISGSATSAVEAKRKLKKSLAKIVLLDLVMPETNGVELCAWIKSNFPEKKVIAFTAETNKALLLNVLKNGADAILIKSCGKQEIIDTIQNVLNGQRIFGTGVPDLRSETGLLPSGRKIKLTPSEHRVLSKMSEVGERSAAAKELGLSRNAINFHCTNIMGKFEEHNMMAVVNQARKANLID